MTTYKNFKIAAHFTGRVIRKTWKESQPRNRYNVSVTNTQTGEKCVFTFFDSLYNTQHKPAGLNGQSTLEAFYCFLSDAESGKMSFEDFTSEFDYDTTEPENRWDALKVWNACRRSAKSWRRVGGMDENDFYNFINELQEIAG